VESGVKHHNLPPLSTKVENSMFLISVFINRRNKIGRNAHVRKCLTIM
jgi:hypothetical protein